MGGFSRSPVSVGQTFGRLTVIEESARAADGHKRWLCRCECGNECVRQSNNLRAGKDVASCGCALSEIHSKHGMRGSPEYRSWRAAKSRCHTKTDKDFHRYGARGIQMCGEWRESFETFFGYMGRRPAGTTLERKDTNGHYEPGNCKWATPLEQARNKRNSTRVQWGGDLLPIGEVAERLGISTNAAFMRHKRGKLYDHPQRPTGQ